MRLSSILYSFRIMANTVMTSFSLNSARLGGSMGRPPIAITGGTVPSAYVVSQRPYDNVTAFFGEIHQAIAHQEVAVSAHAMQSHDQWVFLILCYFWKIHKGRKPNLHWFLQSGIYAAALWDLT